MAIHLGKALKLPLDAVTQTFGILAKRRAGKSYTARRLVEQFVRAAQQVVIVDPKGDWWGIRAHRDGKLAGLPITILGGERGDVPLEVGAGEVVAKLVVEERVSVLLDLSLFRKHELATFMAAFLETLYRLKAREIYRTPMMLVIDEADAIAPQKTGGKGGGLGGGNVERMLGAAEDIVRRGGQRGIGCTLISQRSAVLNKNVLTQVQVLIALRTIAPQDLKALDAWVDVHGTEEQRRTLMASLPSLPVGDAWVWSPGWPTGDGIFERVHVLPIETFDSGETPRVGQKRAEPKTLADVDLAALRKQMAATIERAKADDPKALRARNAALERELAAAKRGSVDPEALERARSDGREQGQRTGAASAEKPLRDQIARLRKALENAMQLIIKINAEQFFQSGGADVDREGIQKALDAAAASIALLVEQKLDARNRGIDRLKSECDRTLEALKKAIGEDVTVDLTVRHNEPFTVTPQKPVRSAAPARAAIAPSEGLTGPEQRVLDALAWWASIGVDPADKGQVGFIAGYRVGKSVGGTFGNLLGKLRGMALLDYPSAGMASLTKEGHALARPPIDAPTTEALQQAIHDRLENTESRVLSAIVDAYPDVLTKQEAGERSGYTVGDNVGGTFGNILGRLRSLGLIDYPTPGNVVALPVLFLEAG